MTETGTKYESRERIKLRNMTFGIDAGLPRYWLNNDPFLTHYFNALSLMFPEGERFFIDSVRNFEDRITNLRLKEDVTGFIGQEASHGREHTQYNSTLRDHGYELQKMEESIQKDMNFARDHFGKRHQLAVTCALEHFTALLADAILHEETHFDGADPHYAAIWQWHALEETEHKAVAFDVYQSMAHGSRGYWRRVVTMLIITFRFNHRVARNLIQLIKQDGQQKNWKGWLRLLAFLWVKPGMIRRRLPLYFRYYKPGFHPWQHDNRRLLLDWQESVEKSTTDY